MKKTELEALYAQIETLERIRKVQGEFDANSKTILILLSTVRELVIHAIEEQSRLSKSLRARSQTKD
jgi:hypothetical protein